MPQYRIEPESFGVLENWIDGEGSYTTIFEVGGWLFQLMDEPASVDWEFIPGYEGMFLRFSRVPLTDVLLTYALAYSDEPNEPGWIILDDVWTMKPPDKDEGPKPLQM